MREVSRTSLWGRAIVTGLAAALVLLLGRFLFEGTVTGDAIAFAGMGGVVYGGLSPWIDGVRRRDRQPDSER